MELTSRASYVGGSRVKTFGAALVKRISVYRPLKLSQNNCRTISRIIANFGSTFWDVFILFLDWETLILDANVHVVVTNG